MLNTSNAVRLPTATAGNGYIFQAQQYGFWNKGSDSVFIYNLDLTNTGYFDKTVNENAKQGDYNLGLGYMRIVTNQHEIGIDYDTQYFYGRTVDFDQDSDAGMSLAYNSNTLSVYYRRSYLKLNYTLKVGAIGTNYMSKTYFENLGANFEDDQGTKYLQAKVDRIFSHYSRMTFIGSIRETEYQERTARDTEGYPNLNNPKLRKVTQKLNVKYQDELLGAPFEVSVSVDDAKDRIYGAEDSVSLFLMSEISFPILSRLDFELSYLWKETRYKNFLADILLLNPDSSQLRVDKFNQYSLGFVTSISNYRLKLGYSAAELDSNFVGTDSKKLISYLDNRLELTLSVSY